MEIGMKIMNKKYKKIVGVLMISLLLPNSFLGIGNSREVKAMDRMEEVVCRYVKISENEEPRYDRDRAIEEEVDEYTLEVMDKYYEIAVAYYQDQEGVMERVRVPVYGNWCGPEYGSGTPIDLLDTGCMNHDKCYGRGPYYSCACDKELIRYIDKNIGKMTGGQKRAAQAVRIFFANKIKNVVNREEDGKWTNCVK